MEYVVVTGSTKGIGKAIGELLLHSGYGVVFNYSTDDDAAQNIIEEFKEFQGRVFLIKQRLETIEDVSNFTDKCLELTREFAAIILNAGTTDRNSWESMTWEQWQRVMDINLNAPAFVAQRLGKHIKEKGNIIFIGSAMGRYPHAISIPYSVSKSGLHFLAKSLVKEYEQSGIRVNVVAPGFVDTPWQKNKPPELRKKIEGKIALARFATTQEIASAVKFLIDNEYMNGAVVDIDGGYLHR